MKYFRGGGAMAAGLEAVAGVEDKTGDKIWGRLGGAESKSGSPVCLRH